MQYKYQLSGELEKQFTDNVIDNKSLRWLVTLKPFGY